MVSDDGSHLYQKETLCSSPWFATTLLLHPSASFRFLPLPPCQEEAARWSLPSLVIDVIPAPGTFAHLSVRHLRLIPGEKVVVNLAMRLGQHLTDDGLDPPHTPSPPHLALDSLSAPRAVIARLIADVRPAICTVVDLTPPNLAQTHASGGQATSGDPSTSTSPPSSSFFFLSRFYEALHYYAGMFDALEESVGFAQSSERQTLEREVLGRAIVTTIASEGHLPALREQMRGRGGVDRQGPGEGREQRGMWGAWLARVGMKPLPVSPNVIAVSAQLLAA